MVTDFVVELIRAANEIDKVSPYEVSRLLYRAIVTIRDLRESIGIPGAGTSADEIVVLYKAAFDADDIGSSARAAALLRAADMLRTLHVATCEGVSMRILEQEPFKP